MTRAADRDVQRVDVLQLPDRERDLVGPCAPAAGTKVAPTISNATNSKRRIWPPQD